jgi:predicted acylesterase/phospholipase RssA
MRVAYQAGVVRALEEAGITFSHADGTSGGTINLAMLLSGNSPAEMCERWRTLNPREFVSFVPLRKYLRPASLIAFGDADGLIRKVYPHLGIDVRRIRAARGIDGTFNVCNYTTKTNEAVPHTEMDIDLLVAAVSLPIFMPPVRRDGAVYTDSVWIKDANLSEALRRGSEEIWLVWCIGNTGVYRAGAFNEYVHMIELSANGGLGEELAHLRAAAGERVPRLHVIKPEYPLPLDPDFYLGRIDADALVAMGYRDATSYLEHRSDEGVAWAAEATRMRDPHPGAAFAERLTGWLRRDGAPTTEVSVRLRADVRDVDRFAADRTAELVGVVDSPALGRGLLARRGSFRLEDGRIVRELVLDHEGRALTLTIRSGGRSWSRLRRAQAVLSDGGPGAEAGELRAGLFAAAVALLRLHATWTDTLRGRLRAHLRVAALLLRGG